MINIIKQKSELKNVHIQLDYIAFEDLIIEIRGSLTKLPDLFILRLET